MPSRPRPLMHLLPVLAILLIGPSAATSAQRGPAAAPNQGRPDLQAERALAATVSEDRMVETVRRLVGFGNRLYGTPSNHASAGWLAEMFADAGLEVRIREDEPRAWYQADSFRLEAVGAGLIRSAWPYSGSPSASGEGPLSLEPAPGTVWLTTGNPDREEAAGCLAVIIQGRAPSSGWPTPGRLRGEGWTVPFFSISETEREALAARVEEGEAIRIAFSLQARTGTDAGHTPVATLPGRDRTKHILFCAHGDADSGGPGADDNASGAAIVLEIARILASAVREGRIPQPAWDVQFAVWGGEISSTRLYAADLPGSPSSLQAVFNFDQSGFGSWLDALYVEPDDVEANAPLVRLTMQAARDHLTNPQFPDHIASIKSQGGTDSYVFQSERTVGEAVYPSITIYTSAWGRTQAVDMTPGFPPINWIHPEEPGKITVDGDAFYHSVGDTPENTTDTEPFNMGWCARVGAISALRLMATR